MCIWTDFKDLPAPYFCFILSACEIHIATSRHSKHKTRTLRKKYILVIQRFRVVSHGISNKSLVFAQYAHEPSSRCVYQVRSGIFLDVPRKRIACNTVEYTTAFLCSDWLCFLWVGIKVIIGLDTGCVDFTCRLLFKIVGDPFISFHRLLSCARS